jgi:periplasmic protein TonB
MNAAAQPAQAMGLIGFTDEDRFPWASFAIGLLIALVLHGSLGATTNMTPPRKMSERVEMAIYKPPPPPPEPPPPPPPEPEKEKPKPPPPKLDTPPPPPPPNETPKEIPPEPVPIVTGISMSSTVQGSGGPVVRVGNTTFGDPNKEKFVDPNAVKPYAGGSKEFTPVRTSSLSREARVLKEHRGRYPPELVEQGVEGTAVMLLDISKDGTVKSARLVKSSGNTTLDKLALDYIKKFVFSPAEMDGQKVDSVLRYSYKFEVYE